MNYSVMTPLREYKLPPNWSIVYQNESQPVYFCYQDPTHRECTFSQWESPLGGQKAALISGNELLIDPLFQAVWKADPEDPCITLEFKSDEKSCILPPQRNDDVNDSKRVVEITNAPTLPYGWQACWKEWHGRTYLYFFTAEENSSQWQVPKERKDCSAINLSSPRILGLGPLPECWDVIIRHCVDHTGLVYLTFTDHTGTHTENRPTGSSCIVCKHERARESQFWRQTNTEDKKIIEFVPNQNAWRCRLCWKMCDQLWNDHQASKEHQIRAHFNSMWKFAAEAAGEPNLRQELKADLEAWESSGDKNYTALRPHSMDRHLRRRIHLVSSGFIWFHFSFFSF